MDLSLEQIKELNKIQLAILKDFIKVCQKLNLRYYMIHGSLLGTLKYKGFFPYDDDIDVAMPREDYEIFIEKGQAFMSHSYFIQAPGKEEQYPLVFSKIRDNNTTFIQPVLRNCKVNKGVYIDVFPIDRSFTSGLKGKWNLFLYNLCKIRVDTLLAMENLNLKYKILIFMSKIFFPNIKEARLKRDSILRDNKGSGCLMTGGKRTEKNMPFEWFAEGVEKDFEGIKVIVPKMYDKYMCLIYGNEYINYSPPAKYMTPDNKVTLSASIVDVEKSYTYYK